MKTLLLLISILGACTVPATSPDAGAISATHDAPHQVAVDAPVAHGDAPTMTSDAAAVACTGALYDGCTTSASCMSNNCKLFSQSGFQVCTQTCSAQNPCPPQNGQPVPCNNMGICKPPAANACTPQ